jgi:hypothetical protein
MCISFRAITDESHVMSLLTRYESRLHRIHNRAQKTLLEFQRTGWTGCAAPSPQPQPTPGLQTEIAPPASQDKPVPTPIQSQPAAKNKKCRNEPTICHVLRQIRNGNPLKTGYYRFRKGSAPAAQAQRNASKAS